MRPSALFMLCILFVGLRAASAQEMRLTMYSDGLSCPGGCDAHVVFHPSVNGTEFAHAPATPVAPFAKCVENSECRICFSAAPAQCLTVMYRGAGPHRDAFDFTPAFYEDHCARPSIPTLLADQCRAFATAAAVLKGRPNCIRSPELPKCANVIDRAKALKSADQPQYDQCRAIGQVAFNKAHPAAARRSNDCAYEGKGTGGPNARGATWRKLLPGACRAGSFVGRDGLDCCSGSPLADGPLGIECRGFYPEP